jgi:selenocysteine lyase/cysteine desulfurase
MISQLDRKLITSQWAAPEDGSIYLNNGSCGRKPLVVLQAIEQGLAQCNLNPTLFTFGNPAPRQEAVDAAGKLFAVDPKSLFLTNSTTNGLQLIMQSFLTKQGDELVTSDREHGSTRTICRYLEEGRGIVVKRQHLDPFAGSKAFCQGVLDLVTDKTKLVVVSEIDCYSGWRPDITMLTAKLAEMEIPLLVDGAHAPGSGPCRPARFPLWVGSGHKWLGGPNGTGFVYVAPKYVSQLKPVWLSDRFYELNDLSRFEWQGTGDVARLLGLTAAINLQMEIKEENVARRQQELMGYLRGKLAKLVGGQIRTPDNVAESSGLLTITWADCKVTHLHETLWAKYRIWVQPDFYFGNVGHGLRVSCHVSTTEAELDKLVLALNEILN